MILLDTNAALWLHHGHRRARPLNRLRGRLYVSPATVLELHFLVEVGRLRLVPGATVADLVSDERWLVDSPPAAEWFDLAAGLSFTRDPFDRLLVAHARLRRWRFATGDGPLLEHLDAAESMEL